MAISAVVAAVRRTLLIRHPLLRYAAAWTTLMTVMVVVMSFSPEMAFVCAVAPSSAFSRSCRRGYVRVPMEGPAGEAICLPSRMLGPSRADLVVPPVFAALVVAGSACFVHALWVWDLDDRRDANFKRGASDF
ncbi:hypothetical protein HPP92_017423 [Vanilla planifolia]|uniref:Uncharacterized protein n=1 Tax=Vanilla planifolia TaxID=51239 RepID=A0A835Q7Y7_VANPL|nr:hypothetical protein HPP92_017423 [Vanilla planifolia]